MKKVVFGLYVLTLVVLATATVVEKSHGTDFAQSEVYGSWWFILMWAALAVSGAIYFLHRRVRRLWVAGIHLALLLILLGALLTRLMAEQDKVHLRTNEPTSFRGTTLELKAFDITYHTGTTSPANFCSTFVIQKGARTTTATVSMNHIFTFGIMRFCQLSYDADMQGSTLAVNIDPWGIVMTYVGYGILFLSLILMLFDPKGRFRQLLRSPLLRQGMLVALFALGLTMAHAIPIQAAPHTKNEFPTTLPPALADSLGRLFIHYNGRICPVQTFALDFTKKVYGKRRYKGLSAEQVLSGWLIWPDLWSATPFIRVKNSELRAFINQSLRERVAASSKGHAPPERNDHYALNDFFDHGAAGGGYILGPMLREYYDGNHDALHRNVADIDGRLQLVLELRRGSLMQIFPHIFEQDYSRTHTEPAVRQGDVLWYAPTDTPHSSIARDESLFIKKVLRLTAEYAHRHQFENVSEVLRKTAVYQRAHAEGVLPSSGQVRAERVLNAVPWVTLLFIANLVMGFVMLALIMRRLASAKSGIPAEARSKAHGSMLIIHGSLFAFLTLVLALRTAVTGTVPLSNGYETTLVAAWFIQLIALVLCRRVRIVLLFGFLLSGFFLLVSHINQMDPAIGLLMPVLDSPWLSVHVSFMMMSYALLSLTFICGIAGLCLRRQADAMQALSRLFLYPALTTLAIGVFVGAIWANVSWGRYWSWDPKETWALITLLIYAVPVHTASLPALSRSRTYHAFMVVAFLAVLMTYFGVNYILGGLHAYA